MIPCFPYTDLAFALSCLVRDVKDDFVQIPVVVTLVPPFHILHNFQAYFWCGSQRTEFCLAPPEHWRIPKHCFDATSENEIRPYLALDVSQI